MVGGQVTPDHYIVNKSTGAIVERHVAEKKFLLEVLPTGGTRHVELEGDARATAGVLTDSELDTLAKLALASERHYAAPQDMEFAVAGDKIFLTQTRPITTLPKAAGAPAPTKVAESTKPAQQPLLRGLAASPGVATGRVRIRTPQRNRRRFFLARFWSRQ